MNELMQAPMEKRTPEKYTVKEVFDSLSYRVTDCDDDYDGFFRLSSDLNGEEVKIPIKDILDCIKGEHRTDGDDCWCNPRVKKVQ